MLQVYWLSGIALDLHQNRKEESQGQNAKKVSQNPFRLTENSQLNISVMDLHQKICFCRDVYTSPYSDIVIKWVYAWSPATLL